MEDEKRDVKTDCLLFDKSKQNFLTAGLLCLSPLGFLGLHRFYLNDSFSKKLGYAYIVTFVLLIVLTIFSIATPMGSSVLLLVNTVLAYLVFLRIVDLFFIYKRIQQNNLNILNSSQEVSEEFQEYQVKWFFLSVATIAMLVL